MVRVVFDTNVIVSAALKPGSLPASLVALAMARTVRLCLSPAILAEDTAVLMRPRFGLDPAAVQAFLRDLRKAAAAVRPSRRAARADYLVTGNKKHFPFPEFEGTKIVSPAEFALLLTL